MIETRVLCDRCKAPGASAFSYVIGRGVDAAGSSSDISLDADLCAKCEIALLHHVLGLFPRNVDIENALTKISYIKKVGP